MIDCVMVDCDTGEDYITARMVLEKHDRYTVINEGGRVLSVIVPDSRNANEEITNLLVKENVFATVWLGTKLSSSF